MTDIFISYARSTEAQARQIAEALRALGYSVWRDDQLPAHRAYADVIEERIRGAKAVLVVWSVEATKSQWVRSEANMARGAGTLVQLSIDGAAPPMPFDQIQCAEMRDWRGETDVAGWRKVVASIEDLLERPSPGPMFATDAPPTLPSKPSIALLPFANLSNDPEQDYFVDGLVDDIATALSKIRTIFVIAGGSSLSFKGSDATPQTIAARLGVRYLLDGSVRRAGGRVRIAVKLIDGVTGNQIWADRFDDTLDDVFALQDKVALGVAGVIEFSVQSAETTLAFARAPVNLRSYDFYLQALTKVRLYQKAANIEALELLGRAINLDPTYALALSLAAGQHALILQYRWDEDPAPHAKAVSDLTERALKTGYDDPQVLANIAAALVIMGDVDQAIHLSERATTLNPGSSWAWMTSGCAQVVAGEMETGVARLDTSIRLDPISPNRSFQIGMLSVARLGQGRFDQALDLSREWDLREGSPMSRAILAAAYGQVGQIPEARASLANYHAASPAPIATIGEMLYRRPEHRRHFLDGIALAES